MFMKKNANLNAVKLTQAGLNSTAGVVKRTRIVQVVRNPFREVYKATGIK
jgi:ribosomal protein S8E